MRLINNYPIIQLKTFHITPTSFGLARNLFAFGEHLKDSEQKLNFLKRCKSRKIHPKFINNAIKINHYVLFPSKCSSYGEALINSLKCLALSQVITNHYENIRKYKSEIVKTKKSLMESLLSRDIYVKLMNIFEQNNESIKESSKKRHQKKYDWLVQCSNKPPTNRVSTNDQGDSPVINLPVIEEPVENRVTVINANISPEEQSLLALGPKFALTPRIDEKLLDSVKAEIAACAFKLRWKTHFGQTSSCPTLLQHLKQTGCKFQRPFTHAPPTFDTDIEDSLKELNNFVLRKISKAKLKFNLSHDQSVGLKLLKTRRDQLHISVSDKGGEFVIMKLEEQKELTLHHITSTGVYKSIPPTRKYKGTICEVSKPSQSTYIKQINTMVDTLEKKCNDLWGNICEQRGLSAEIKTFFNSHNTQLPTMYVLLKTHKFDVREITSTSNIREVCKVRPIVSCCGSPTEKLAWILTSILSPLLSVIPSHLQNITQHLQQLAELTPNQLKGYKFCCADVTSLYTNIDIVGCINDIIELAEEHIGLLNLYGLKLVDIHQMLEVVFGNAYFRFDNKLNLQLIGLFMGCKPSPIGAIIRVYMFERRSIYVDVHYLPLFYGRYVDDSGTLGKTRQRSELMFNTIAEQDPDGRLGWEVDFPDEEGSFTPFLSTEIKIDTDGKLHTKFYRKEQKKQITLHYRSHHSQSTKIGVIKQFYKTAEASSSSQEYVNESFKIIDYLLQCNGYSNPRQYINHRLKGTRPSGSNKLQSVPLKLPYVSEQISDEILKFIKTRKLPVNVIFTPGTKLRDLFCSSRPHDGRKCATTNCQVCPRLPEGQNCTIMCPVYKITCQHCGEVYVGETCRCTHDRVSEHTRYANNPSAPSYKDQAFAIHYRDKHPDQKANLKIEILKTESNTVLRKIYEAYFIYNLKPTINDKSECKTLYRFLVKSDG